MRLLRGAARRLCAAASPGFPRGVEELTPAWATQALLDGGHLSPSERVASVSAVPMGAGVGLASSMARLSLGIEGGAGPARRLSCVAKFPPPAGSAARVAAERMGAFAREVGFYRAVAASEGGGGNGNHGLALPLGVPAALFAGHSPPCGSALLLLEDLSPAVWSGGDQVAGATPSQAAAVVSAAAALHARFWGDPRLRGGWARTWLPALDGAQAPGWDAAGFDAAWPAFRAAQPAAVAALPPACVAALDAGCFAHAAAALLARLGGGGGLPVTLLHGDLRLDNALFRTPSPPSAQPGGGGPPGEVALIDLGDCAAGRGASIRAFRGHFSSSSEI